MTTNPIVLLQNDNVVERIEAEFPIGTKVERRSICSYGRNRGQTTWSSPQTVTKIGRTGAKVGQAEIGGRWTTVFDFNGVANYRVYDAQQTANERALYCVPEVSNPAEARKIIEALTAAYTAAIPATASYRARQGGPSWRTNDEGYSPCQFNPGTRVRVVAAGADGKTQPWFITEGTVLAGRKAYTDREDYAIRFDNRTLIDGCVGWCYGYQIVDVLS